MTEKRNANKIVGLVLFLVITVVVAIALSMTASAALSSTATGGCDGNHSGYTAIDSPKTISKAGKYYLTGDVFITTYEYPLKIYCSGTVTLCLNGYDLYHAGNGNCVLDIEATDGDLTVNLCDCVGSGEIYHAKVKSAINLLGDKSNGYYAILNMYGGTIRDSSSGVGENANSIFNMYGGTIKNCSNYGIIQGSSNGKVNIYGGTITGNAEGIRVCSADAVTLTGSPSIYGNTNGDIYYRFNYPIIVEDLSISQKLTLGFYSAANFNVAKVDTPDAFNYFKCVDSTQGLTYYDGKVSLHNDDHLWKDATCVTPKTCTLCGATESDELAPDNHEETAENGFYTCCGAACEHIGGTLSAPVITDDGRRHFSIYDCCNKKVTENHSTTSDGDKAATCNSRAYCSVCENEYGTVNKKNHNEDLEYVKGFCENGCYEPATLNEDGYYEISNAGQLYWFARLVNIDGQMAVNAILMADIDLEGRRWYPIGLYNDIAEENGNLVISQYKGTFDGNGHTVSNFVAIGNGSQGLLGYCSSKYSKIKNLGVINANVSGWNAGAVAGFSANMENCYALDCTIIGKSDINTEGVTISSLGGNNGTNNTIINCFAYNCTLILGEGEESYVMHPLGGIYASTNATSNIQNSYYVGIVNEAEITNTDNATPKSLTALANGEIAYLLGEAFGQEIGKDAYPVFGGMTVYYGYISCANNDTKVYTNNANAYEEKPQHNNEAVVTSPDCENGGYTTYTCVNCGDSYVGDETSALGHDYDAVVTNPDCENGGYTTYTCANCGDSYVGDETAALGHDWVDATYDEPKTCSVCGESEGQPLQKPEDTSKGGSELTTEVKTEINTESETEVNSEVKTEVTTEATTEATVESTPVATDDIATEAVSGDEADDGEKSGCGSSIGVPIAIVAVIGFVGFSIYKKKER